MSHLEVELCMAVTQIYPNLLSHRKAKPECDQRPHPHRDVDQEHDLDNCLPLSHLLVTVHDCPVEELCLAALGQSMALQLVSDQPVRHYLVVCRGDLSQVDHPDQEVIAHLQQSSACRKSADG